MGKGYLSNPAGVISQAAIKYVQYVIHTVWHILANLV